MSNAPWNIANKKKYNIFPDYVFTITGMRIILNFANERFVK